MFGMILLILDLLVEEKRRLGIIALVGTGLLGRRFCSGCRELSSRHTAACWSSIRSHRSSS